MDILVIAISNQIVTRGSKLKQNLQKNKVVTRKTPVFVIGSFCTPHSICLNFGFDRAVLYENVAFSILVL